MRLDGDEVVASIERLADPEEDAGTIESADDDAAPVAIDEAEGGDTVPVDMSKAIATESDDEKEEEE
jgi:hypothetical protein